MAVIYQIIYFPRVSFHDSVDKNLLFLFYE